MIFLITSVFPCFYFTQQELKNVPEQETMDILKWLKENSDENATISATPDQGYIINAIADRKNIIDSDFLLVKDPSQRLIDIQTIYRTYYKTEAVSLLNKYNVDYILFSPKAKTEFDIQNIRYIEDEKCFKPIFTGKVSLYKSLCKIEEI